MELPNSIGDLKHLRYLDISESKFKEIPSSVCKLYNLQTLLMSNCEEITQLPANMCCLINLRHLEISGTPLKEMPPQMCKLSNLQTLSDFVLGENGGYRIKELGNLQSLHGSLRICGLENVVDIGDALQADLKNKECLTELILIWEYGKTDDSTKEREVLAALEPHKKLKKLRIGGYGGTTFPGWIAHESFSDMVEVEWTGCLNCCLLPPLGQLPALRILCISYMDGLESIGDEFCGTSVTKSFPSLEELGIYALRSLCKWSITGAEQEGEIFAHLKSIRVLSCDKLKVGLPAGCFPSLETIDFHNCKEMVSVLPKSQVEVDAEQKGEIFPHLKSIRVFACDKLKVGLPAGYFPSLETIDIEDCKEMVSVLHTSQVEVDSAYPSLEFIDLWSCPRLESFSGTGFPSNLTKLRIIDCPKLIANRLKWGLQRLSSLRKLFLRGFKFEGAVDSFPEEGLLPSSLTSLTIFSFRNLKALNAKSFQHLTSLQELEIWYCDELQCLPEGLPISLTHLEILKCYLLMERCQRGTGEDWPKIQLIPNTRIDYIEI